MESPMQTQNLCLFAKRVVSVAILFGVLCSGWISAMAQVSTSTEEIEQLKSLIGQQQKTLEQQQTEIQELRSALAEQKRMLADVDKHRGAVQQRLRHRTPNRTTTHKN